MTHDTDRSPSDARKPPLEPRVSRTRKPKELSAADWQVALRRQYGREQDFGLERIGAARLLSEYVVVNTQSQSRYRVAIRGPRVGDNYCSCPDFATNELGTCKHIEFTLKRLFAKRGAGKAFARDFEAPYSEVYLSYGARRQLRFRAGAECPPRLAERGQALFAEGAESKCELDELLREAEKAGHEVRVYDDARAFLAEQRDAQHRRRIFAQAFPQGSGTPALRDLLKTPLYPYQAEGALFAATAGRALIGDDMGLGKTIQAIAAAELLSRHCGAERVLIVCPTSLKHQWQREVARFTARDAIVIRGLSAARRQQWTAAEPPCWARITSYETLVRDLDLINAWAPDVVIVDEAQRIKNWNTIAARALKRIASPYAIVLTGTPLQNRLEELISIVQFVDQHRLGPTWRLQHEHQFRDEAGRVIGYRGLDRIGQTLAPIMLRRRKDEVLDQLPERIDNTLFVPMTPEQLEHHEENGDIVARIVKRWRKTGFLSDADQRRLTCALQNMRMSCNSTFLLDHETDHGGKADELIALLDELFEQPDAKAIVFSQWLGTHELIARRLRSRGWGHVLFHGGVPSEQRPALIDRFHADPDCRVFLSTDAGGVGLNLQHAAATIVNMDLPWNPAVLEQRIGRVHRLGQTRSVQVVNFVAQGSIEEGMLSVLAFKRSLFAGVLDGGQSEIFMEGTRLAKFMETVEEVTGAVGEAEVAETGTAAAQTKAAEPTPAAFAESGGDAAPEQGSADAAAFGETQGSMSSEAQASTQPPGIAQDPAQAETLDTDQPETLDTDQARTPDPKQAGPSAQPSAPSPDPWGLLLDAGLQFAQALVERRETDPAAAWSIERDPRSGREVVKLPLPQPQTIERIAAALHGLLAGLRQGDRR